MHNHLKRVRQVIVAIVNAIFKTNAMLNFHLLNLITQLIGVVVVSLTVWWVVEYLGVVWDSTNIKFYNWHPICMVVGMVFLFGNCEFFHGSWKLIPLNRRQPLRAKSSPLTNCLSVDDETLLSRACLRRMSGREHPIILLSGISIGTN